VHADGPNISGFVGYDPDLKAILIAFAGTDPHSLRNWSVGFLMILAGLVDLALGANDRFTGG
jgi:hypothetical protein